MKEGEMVGLGDLLKVKVFDSDGKHVGHVQDLAIERHLIEPVVRSLGVHVLWTDRVGEIELVRRVEDVVVLVPWEIVEYAGEDSFRLTASHLDLPVESAADMWLLRRDLLNKQMVDPRRSRINRVDDVLLRATGPGFTVAGLEVSKGLMITSSSLRHYVASIRRKYLSRHDTDVIPWEAVSRLEPDSIVLCEEVQGGREG